MSAPPGARACLTEDELLALATGALADDGAAETHLASCALCVALMAAAARATPLRAWDALVGATLGPYRLDELIGAGGMGAVYRALRNDGLFDQRVAIKFIRPLHRSLPAEAMQAWPVARTVNRGSAEGAALIAQSSSAA